jgi:hypothetical protein
MKYNDYFITKTRQDGKRFVCLVDNHPAELKDLIREIHEHFFFNAFPNDWIYAVICEAFEAIELDGESYTVEPDIYYYDLNKWIVEPFAHEYLNEALENNTYKDFYILIQDAQEVAKQRIYTAVRIFLEEEKDEI